MKQLKNYAHIIWDFNGTLINDLDLGIELQRIMLEEAGKKAPSREFYLDTFDFPIIDWYERLGHDISKYSQLADIWNNLYYEKADSCPLNEGIADLLAAISAAKIPQSILSASNMVLLGRLLSALGIAKYFDHVYASENNLAEGKLHLCRRLKEEIGLPGEKMLLIGDTTQDFLTAEKIGCDCALVALGHQSYSRLQKVTSSVFADFSELSHCLFPAGIPVIK